MELISTCQFNCPCPEMLLGCQPQVDLKLAFWRSASLHHQGWCLWHVSFWTLMNDLLERIFWYFVLSKTTCLTLYFPCFNTIHECWLNMCLNAFLIPIFWEFCIPKMLLYSLWMNSPNLYLFIITLFSYSHRTLSGFLTWLCTSQFVVSGLVCVTTTWLVDWCWMF